MQLDLLAVLNNIIIKSFTESCASRKIEAPSTSKRFHVCHKSDAKKSLIVRNIQAYFMEDSYPLFVKKIKLQPSDEWSPGGRGWIMVRVAEGSGYCRHTVNACELNSGDGFTAPTNSRLFVRASQLGFMELQSVRIEPDYLNGLLTVAEWFRLEAAQSHLPCIFYFKAHEIAGQKFARLVDQASGQRLSTRCGLLQFWANGVASLLADSALAAETNTGLRQRFRQLMEHMPETELFRHPLSDLARQLQCSERHFSRLFSAEFGVSFRSHQIELRLQHACRLLTEPGHKIAIIANESGYQHIGLFNKTFKKRFGVTPSEWRHQLQNHLSSTATSALRSGKNQAMDFP